MTYAPVVRYTLHIILCQLISDWYFWPVSNCIVQLFNQLLCFSDLTTAEVSPRVIPAALNECQPLGLGGQFANHSGGDPKPYLIFVPSSKSGVHSGCHCLMGPHCALNLFRNYCSHVRPWYQPPIGSSLPAHPLVLLHGKRQSDTSENRLSGPSRHHEIADQTHSHKRCTSSCCDSPAKLH